MATLTHEHPVDILFGTAPWICDGCHNDGSGNRFHCVGGCDFDFCQNCWNQSDASIGKDATTVKGHDHTVRLFQGEAWNCDGCSQRGVGLRYRCTAGCDYDLCQVCFSRTMENSRHSDFHKTRKRRQGAVSTPTAAPVAPPRSKNAHISSRAQEIYDSLRGPYEDTEFPASNSSIGTRILNDLSDKNVQWKRPSQFAPNAVFIADGMSPDDVVQGQVGDCWFISGVSVVASRKDLIDRVVRASHFADKGMYVFAFYKFGEWHEVIIDDRIPCSSRGPLFAKSDSDNELWISMVEKAFAKLHGSYSALDGGWISDALVDMTGGVPEQINFEEVQDQISSGAFFNQLKTRYESGLYLMGCAKAATGARETDEAGLGILTGHAYGILEVREVNGHRMLKCRNPWGCREWTGPWSDKDRKNWTPAMKSALNWVDKDDGEFWIEYSDFQQQFSKVNFCHLFGPTWTHTTFAGAWRGAKAAGCINNYATFFNNPQFQLNIQTPTKVLIRIEQPDPRSRGEDVCKICIGFYVYKSAGRVTKHADVVHQSNIVNLREISGEMVLQPGNYGVIVFTFDAHEETDYHVGFHGEHAFRATSLDGDQLIHDEVFDSGEEVAVVEHAAAHHAAPPPVETEPAPAAAPAPAPAPHAPPPAVRPVIATKPEDPGHIHKLKTAFTKLDVPDKLRSGAAAAGQAASNLLGKLPKFF